MARALTSGELADLRTDGQGCLLYLAVHTPATVYTARLNGVPSSDDEVYEITYDGGAGTPAQALVGMTVYVGSAAGLYDKGQFRLRETLSASSGTMKTGELSDIDWADDDYLTVVDEFGLWPKHLRIDSGGVIYMDYDIPYSDQHANCDPVPVLGPPAVVWLTGATVDVEFDASDSWVVGSTISAYSWTATGASATSGTATATPTITYNAAGSYRVSCLVTATNGATLTGYRRVFVYDASNPPMTVLQLGNCSGDWQRGGWSFSVTAWDEATRAEIRDRAMVVLFARDYYDGDEESIGPVADRENVVAVGWISGESIQWDPEQGQVSFDVQGPQHWLGQMQGYPSGIEDYDGTPTTWVEFNDLTVDKGLWHFLNWRTTATVCLDAVLTGDARQIKVFDAPPGSLWSQMSNEAKRTILAQACCDRYGRLFVEIDSQLLPTASRSGIPTVQTLLAQDWHGQVNIRRVTVLPTAQLDLSGVAYDDGDATPLFSLSPGHVYGRYGGIEQLGNLALTDQTQANELAGLVLGNRNNQYPTIGVALAANNRAFDVTPHQYGVISVVAGDTERGIELTNLKLVPRRVSFRHDARAGTLLANVDYEGYTDETGGITGDPPPEPPTQTVTPPTVPPAPPEPTVPTNTGCILTSKSQIAVTFNIETDPPTWYNGDPNGDVTGDILHVIGMGNVAYAASYDGGTSRLWFCSDLTAAVDGTISWTQLASSATVEYGAFAVVDGEVIIGGAGGTSSKYWTGDDSGALTEHSYCLVWFLSYGSWPYVCPNIYKDPTTQRLASSYSFQLATPRAGGFLGNSLYACGRSVNWGAGTAYISPYYRGADGNTLKTCLCSSNPVSLSLSGLSASDGGYGLASDDYIYGGDGDGGPPGSGEVAPSPAFAAKANRIGGVYSFGGCWYVGLSDYYLYLDGVALTDNTEFNRPTYTNGRGGRFAFSADNSFMVRAMWYDQWNGSNGYEIAKYNIVLFSDDLAVTWTDKTGNLADAIDDTWWRNQQMITLFEIAQGAVS